VSLAREHPGEAFALPRKLDKEDRADRLRFVVLDGSAKPAIVEARNPGPLFAAYGGFPVRLSSGLHDRRGRLPQSQADGDFVGG
jgi:hypothetical protein